jgi:DNA-binding transcriptional regulator YdaS (Cro superfamily)
VNEKAFDQAVADFGGPTKIAEALNESVQTIVNWRARGAVPASRCKAFEALTGVHVRHLREDWAKYWPEAMA